MGDMLSPDVYISELDYSEYVSSTSTCIVGMVGAAKRGPIGVPTLVTTQAQMVSIFGTPSELEYGVYSALAALTKASSLYYVRVVRNGSKASAGSLGTDKVLYTAVASGTSYNGITIEQTAVTEGVFNVTVKAVTTGTVLETYTDLSLTGTADGFIETVINGVSQYIVAKMQYSGSIIAKTFTLAGGAGSGTYANASQITYLVGGTPTTEASKLTFRSKYFDSTINSCVVVISEADMNGYFDITLKDENSSVIETWSDLVMTAGDERYVESFINARSSRMVCTVSTAEGVTLKAGTLTFSGGDDGIEGITNTDIIGEADNTGLSAFSDPEGINIDLLSAPGWSDPEVVHAGISLCEDRTECLYIADTPFNLSANEVVEWSNGSGSYTHAAFNSSYGAIYWPWVKISDSYTSKNKWMPPSGYVIAQYAYNDSVAHPWFAPAGLNRGVMSKPIGLEISPTKGERDIVYGNRNVINPLVNYLQNGITIWGQKTTQRKPTALDRVNVRRLMNYLKKTIGLSTKYFVFEQNDETTWNLWIDMVKPTLRSIKERRGIYDFKIEIAPSTDDIENNRMPVVVKIKPTKDAEYIPLSFMVMPTSASFED